MRSARRLPYSTFRFEGFQILMGPCESCPRELDPWIKQFLHQPGNSWYVHIDPDWAADWFNQYGINNYFDDFDAAIELITDKHGEDWVHYTEENVAQIHQQAIKIYGLLHARWITQPRGMSMMKDKYEKGVFGVCPRHQCNGTKLLPMGQTLTPKRHSAKLFCPKCCDIYRSMEHILLDGAHFGPAFPHIFLSEYTQFDVRKQFRPEEVKAFGFKVYRGIGAGPKVHDTNIHDDEDQ